LWAWVEPLACWTAVASLAAAGGACEACWSPVPVERCHLLAAACGSHVVLWCVCCARPAPALPYSSRAPPSHRMRTPHCVGHVSHRRTPPDPLPLVRGGGERRRVSTAVSEQGMEVAVQAEEVGRLAHSAQVRDRPRHKRFGPCTPPQLHYTITWRPYVQNPFSSHTGRPKDSFAMVCTLLTSPTTLHHPSLTTRSGGDHRRCARWTGT